MLFELFVSSPVKTWSGSSSLISLTQASFHSIWLGGSQSLKFHLMDVCYMLQIWICASKIGRRNKILCISEAVCVLFLVRITVQSSLRWLLAVVRRTDAVLRWCVHVRVTQLTEGSNIPEQGGCRCQSTQFSRRLWPFSISPAVFPSMPVLSCTPSEKRRL